MAMVGELDADPIGTETVHQVRQCRRRSIRATIGKCSADTALRDINDLLASGVLRRLEGGGRSTAYELAS